MPTLHPSPSHSPGERRRRVLERPQVPACPPSPVPVGEVVAAAGGAGRVCGRAPSAVRRSGGVRSASLAIRDQEVVRGSWVSQPQHWTGLLGLLTWMGLLGSVLRDLPPVPLCPAPGVLGMPNSQLGKGKGQAPDFKLRSRCPGVHSPCKCHHWALSAPHPPPAPQEKKAQVSRQAGVVWV